MAAGESLYEACVEQLDETIVLAKAVFSLELRPGLLVRLDERGLVA